MKKNIFTSSFLLFFSFNVLANIWDFPVQKWTCYAYPQFAIWQFDNQGMGAEEIKVRRVSKEMSANDLCKNSKDPKDILLKDAFGYFKGAFENILFITSPDSFGALEEVMIYDAQSGKELIHEQAYDCLKDVLIKRVNDKISLSFFKPLEISCPLTKGNDSCWKKILKENKVPDNIKIQFPNCQDAINKMNEYIKKNPKYSYDIDNRTFQITTEVQIDDLYNPKNIRYVGGISNCYLTP